LIETTIMKIVVAILLAVAIFAVVEAHKTIEQVENYSFAQYVSEFKKTYTNQAEFNYRKKIFEHRVTKIREHNADPSFTWKEGVNRFSDKTEKELEAVLGYDKSIGFKIHASKRFENKAHLVERAELPPSVDWRTKGVITPVKDQGGCGSCWCFGTTESIESFWALAGNPLPVLSEQQSLDCTPNPDDCGGTGGCGGGTAELIYAQVVKTGGVTTEASYPYQGEDEPCQNSSIHPVAFLTGFVNVSGNQQPPVLQAVATQGPLVINVDASSWFGYSSGVFDGCNQQNPDIDHVVQLVGYGTDSSAGDYWLVRNSWGSDWGENGYIRLARPAQPTCGVDTNPQDGTGCNGGPSQVTVCGTCGILFDVTYPVMKTK